MAKQWPFTRPIYCPTAKAKAEEKEPATQKKEKATNATTPTKAKREQAAKEKKEKAASPLFCVSSESVIHVELVSTIQCL